MAAEQFNSVVIIFHDAQEKSICVTWQVPDRYKDLAAIGKGAYGNVCSAYDKETKQKVAIKKLARPFETPIHAKRTYRELRLLRHMKHDNVIGLLDVFTPQNNQRDFQDIYFVTHLMGGDLCTVMRSPELTDKHVQFLVYQMLRGLKYIHSAGVIHRDLKPSNIAVNDDCELRILDFGLAREAQDIMTGYVATRWYRAPEIMLNWMHYTQTVDIWSAGCIMAEMVSGSPLFPGTDAISQLNLILELVGVPGEALLSKIECQDARTYIASLHPAPPKDFKNVFPDASLEAVDLLKKMLELDPERRITAKDALAHPYLVSYHDVADEPVCDEPFEEQDWKRLVFQDVHTFPRPGASVKKLSSNLESPELVLTNPEVQMPITDKRPVGDRESDVFVPVPKRSRNELTVAGNDDHH